MTVTAVSNQPQVISYTVTYDELVGGAPFRLPTAVTAGWMVDDVGVETIVPFNGTEGQSLNVGVVGAPDAIVEALDVKETGILAPTVVKYRSEGTDGLVIQLVSEEDLPTAGVVRVSFVLMQVAREN